MSASAIMSRPPRPRQPVPPPAIELTAAILADRVYLRGLTGIDYVAISEAASRFTDDEWMGSQLGRESADRLQSCDLWSIAVVMHDTGRVRAYTMRGVYCEVLRIARRLFAQASYLAVTPAEPIRPRRDALMAMGAT